ncbi:DNA-3-methyladenine glycosylase family protein [Nucisporomicrobium flavum]|uniref:DNA-3-methyladenine glycosylase family protein n=1 Tax=Nucisporomicrobium flavum TaxID=2785915 RepID=UPI0027DB1531|nr:DNA-3-methyladenine glycosylase 2 family protein [Nucisporomicrobium flavum]
MLTGPMTPADLRRGVAELTASEPLFAAVEERHGFPLMWDRAPGFASLVHIMLEQQVSLASARATFDRLRALADPLTAESLLALDDRQLREAVADAVVAGSLRLEALAGLDDQDVDRQLRAVPGIGPWTAAIYRLSALGRPDAWPAGDLAVAAGIAQLWNLPALPSPAETVLRAEAWRPWRAVAARLLWQQYLGTKLRPPA